LKNFILPLLFICININANAQYLNIAKPIIDTLCSKKMAGRGYVNNGLGLAKDYLVAQFQQIGLNSFENNYLQSFNFNVNTFPTKINCTLDNEPIEAGAQFLLDADNTSHTGTYKLLPFSITNETDKQLLYLKMEQGLQEKEIVLFKNAENNKELNTILDSFKKLNYRLPLIVKSSSKKLLWTVSQTVSEVPEITFPDTLINTKENLSISYNNIFLKNFESNNIIGYLPAKKSKNKGAKPYMVVTAHYDHLGMMGSNAYFPGASDNASGVSMLLNLANYFKAHPQSFPIIFILFSGEEAGLMGSKYFVHHPLFSLEKIKLLVNVDIMGSAEAGITVVNGEVYKNVFDKIVDINKQNKYLPEIKIRGKAANSDHYYFSEAGVPSIFIYSNGGPGWYHDVWDKPNTLTTTNYDNTANLLIKLIEEF
jgi:aminopeptidase YwaD